MAKSRKELESEALSHNPFAALAPPSPKKAPDRASEAVEETASESPAATPIPKGKVVLRREKKGRGGKTVTRIEGLPRDELKRYASAMKKALGCGASVEGDSLLLHGNLNERGASWLREQGFTRVVVGN